MVSREAFFAMFAFHCQFIHGLAWRYTVYIFQIYEVFDAIRDYKSIWCFSAAESAIEQILSFAQGSSLPLILRIRLQIDSS